MSNNPTRLFDLLTYQYKEHPLEDAFCQKIKGKWHKYTTRQVIQITRILSMGLMELGLKKGDKVAIASENRPEWNFVDFACQQIGVVTVPMYPNIGPRDYEYILHEADVKLIFVSNNQILQKIKTATFDLPRVKIFTFNNI